MIAYVFSKEQYDQLVKQMNRIEQKLDDQHPNQDDQIDNEDFIKMMKICRTTALKWRNEGKLKFTKVGRKIYYRRADVAKFMADHNYKEF